MVIVEVVEAKGHCWEAKEFGVAHPQSTAEREQIQEALSSQLSFSAFSLLKALTLATTGE